MIRLVSKQAWWSAWFPSALAEAARGRACGSCPLLEEHLDALRRHVAVFDLRRMACVRNDHETCVREARLQLLGISQRDPFVVGAMNDQRRTPYFVEPRDEAFVPQRSDRPHQCQRGLGIPGRLVLFI